MSSSSDEEFINQYQGVGMSKEAYRLIQNPFEERNIATSKFPVS